MLKLIYRGTFVILAIYATALAYLFVNQRALLYPLKAELADISRTGIARLEQIKIKTSDNEQLIVWLVPPRNNKAVLLYFPGNAGNLAHPERVYAFKKLTADGTGLLAVSYRGYGGSSGHPTEDGLRLDALALYDEGVRRYGAQQLFAFGHSLGSGVAAKLALEKKVAGLILEAPYTSTAAIAQKRYWYVPISLLMLDQFHTEEIIDKINAPILILHGDQDKVIPVSEGQKLFELAKEPKQLVIFAGGKHDNLQHLGATADIHKFILSARAEKFK